MRVSGAHLGAAVVLSGAALGLPLGAHATRSASISPCSPQVHHGVLPVWMRGGFGSGKPTIPYVLGKDGAIGGVLFGSPLNAPPAQNKNNKILWVPRHVSKGVAALWIRMQKMDGTHLAGAPIRRVIATGPGPSYVDAPSPGCWRLTLSWSGRRDTLDWRTLHRRTETKSAERKLLAPAFHIAPETTIVWSHPYFGGRWRCCAADRPDARLQQDRTRNLGGRASTRSSTWRRRRSPRTIGRSTNRGSGGSG